MTEGPEWQYDEEKHCGIDYADAGIAARYDENHLRFRDYKKSAEHIISALSLGANSTVVDMGCGTGAFVLHAAPTCKKVHAVDVSAAMLEHLRTKAESDGLDNIAYHQAGFLTYEHTDDPVDAVVSVAALHHLPDFWKFVGLCRIADILRPGGSMYLFDVVFQFDAREHRATFDQWVLTTKENIGTDFADEIVTHIRDEHSTCGWILEGLLERAGFSIHEQNTEKSGIGTTYICTRKSP